MFAHALDALGSLRAVMPTGCSIKGPLFFGVGFPCHG